MCFSETERRQNLRKTTLRPQVPIYERSQGGKSQHPTAHKKNAWAPSPSPWLAVGVVRGYFAVGPGVGLGISGVQVVAHLPHLGVHLVLRLGPLGSLARKTDVEVFSDSAGKRTKGKATR